MSKNVNKPLYCGTNSIKMLIFCYTVETKMRDSDRRKCKQTKQKLKNNVNECDFPEFHHIM